MTGNVLIENPSKISHWQVFWTEEYNVKIPLTVSWNTKNRRRTINSEFWCRIIWLLASLVHKFDISNLPWNNVFTINYCIQLKMILNMNFLCCCIALLLNFFLWILGIVNEMCWAIDNVYLMFNFFQFF